MNITLEFDHIGIIVPGIAPGRAFLEAALGVTCWTPVVNDPPLGVSVQFGSAQGTGPVYELIAPLMQSTAASTESVGGELANPIANALRQGKHILNHVAYLTPDLVHAGLQLREQGCFPAGPPQPALAYGGAAIQFWLSPLRFVIELIEKPGHRHPLSPQPALAPRI